MICMKNILITGANSFIGRNLIDMLPSEYNVLAVKRASSKCTWKRTTKTIDISMEQYHSDISRIDDIDCLVHFAWQGTRGFARNDEAMQNYNLECSKQLIGQALDKGCKKVVLAGSQAEYGPHVGMITEDCACLPNTEYGKAKLKLFNWCTQLCVQYGAVCIEPRFFSLYGPGDYEYSLIMSSVKKMLSNEECNFTQSIQKWDFLYIDDAARALKELCVIDCAAGAYNFGSGDCRILKDYIEEMKLVLGSRSKLNYGSIPYSHEGMVSINPCIDKIKQETNWCPSVSFAEGIECIKKSINRL